PAALDLHHVPALLAGLGGLLNCWRLRRLVGRRFGRSLGGRFGGFRWCVGRRIGQRGQGGRRGDGRVRGVGGRRSILRSRVFFVSSRHGGHSRGGGPRGPSIRQFLRVIAGRDLGNGLGHDTAQGFARQEVAPQLIDRQQEDGKQKDRDQ